MKLNRKGYMLVEIIIAAVLAMSIAYYLLNLTYKFKNTNEDVHQSYLYAKDKLLITKNIMNDLKRGEVLLFDLSNDKKLVKFGLKIREGNTQKVELKGIKITNENGSSKIEYGKMLKETGDNYVFDTTDVSYYVKELEPNLFVDEIIINSGTAGFSIEIPVEQKIQYILNADYSIKLYSNKLYYLDLGFIIDNEGDGIFDGDEWYPRGYPMVQNGIGEDLKVDLMINGEEVSVYDLCGYYPYGTQVKLIGVQYKDGTYFEYEREFILDRDISMYFSFIITESTVRLVNQKNLKIDRIDNDGTGYWCI